LKPYTVGHQRLEVVNDVFSGVEYVLSCRPATSRTVSSMTPCCRVARYCSDTRRVVNRSALHYSHTVAACPHVLPALNMLFARTSYMPMMVLTSGVLEIYARALGTCEPSCTGMSARLFFMLISRGPHDMWQSGALPAGRQDLES
jgi:hypothetical protein